MLNEIVNLYGIVIGTMFIIGALYKLNNKKIDIKDKNFYIGTIMYILIQLLLANISFAIIRPVIGFIALTLMCSGILKKDIKESLVSALFIYIFLLLSEFLLIVIILIVSKITSTISLNNLMMLMQSNAFFSLPVNLSFAILLYFTCNTKKIRDLYVNINKFFYRKKFKNIYIILVIIFLVVLTAFKVIYFGGNLITTVFIFFVSFIFIIYVTIKDLKISYEYELAKERYINTSKSLIEYEEMIDKYRVNNHENKNQLRMIRNMIKQKDKLTENYIDNLLDTVYMENEALMMDVSIIPAGGLRASIYSKLLNMDHYHIKHVLNIDHKLRSVDFFENNLAVTLKICNLLSIFIDNAIEEVNLHNDKVINIDIYLDDESTVIFEITNKIVSVFDITKIYEKKYTTKSNGHGYGLALAKEIINSEDRITNKVVLDETIFTQILIINIQTKNDK